MSVLESNGVRLHYDDGGDGPPLLLTHGFSATGDMWLPQRLALQDHYRIVTWDLRGHGRTDYPEDPKSYSHSLSTADMLALLDHLGIEKATIGGLSLGGFLSLLFHRQHPERTQALLICDTGPGYRNPESRAAWNENAEKRARDFEQRGLDALATASREMREAIAQHRSAEGLAHAARGMLAQFDSSVIDHLPDVDVPTLIVVGSEDRPFLVSSEYMARKIPGARLEVIEGAGHAASLDQPERFNQAVSSFLAEVAAA